jgi:ArsR family transcriptional regulator
MMAVERKEFFEALASTVRLRIISLLQGGPMTVGTIADALGRPVTDTSAHLRVLRLAGVVTDRKLGRVVEYRLDPDSYDPGPPGSLIYDDVRVVLPGEWAYCPVGMVASLQGSAS